MDMLKLLQQASSPAEVQLLLQAMGQKGSPNAAPVQRPAVDPMAAASANALLSPAIMPQSVDAMRALLNSMGQTGAMAAPGGAASPKQYPQQSSQPATPVTAEEIAPLIDKITGVASTTPAEPMAGSKTTANGKPLPIGMQANTKYGVERVNENTGMHGVTATRDANGRVTLTNMDASGKPTEQSQKQVYGFNPANSSTSSAVTSLMDQLTKTTDVDTARGLASTLRVAFAEESTKMQQEAIKQAEHELGVTSIRNDLRSAEAMDQAKPGFMPGIGDSKATLLLRQRLADAQKQVDGRAKEWLDRNISFNRLKAMSVNAEGEVKRIVDKGLEFQRKKDLITTKAEEKDAAKKEAAKIAYDGLSPTQKQVLIRLNPTLAKEGNEEEAVAYVNRQAKIDKDFTELLQADPTEYKNLAFGGNKHAAQLLAEEEASRTGQPPADVEKAIKELTTMPVSPAMVQDWITSTSGRAVGDKGDFRKAKQADWNDALSGKTPEQKAKLSSMQAEIRISAYRKKQTDDFMGNVMNWAGPSSPLRVAAQKSLATSGKADLDSTLGVLIQGQDAPTVVATLKSVKDEVSAAAASRQKSIFGGIDTLKALGAIDNAISSNEGILGVLRNAINQQTGSTVMQAVPGGAAAQWGLNTFKF